MSPPGYPVENCRGEDRYRGCLGILQQSRKEKAVAWARVAEEVEMVGGRQLTVNGIGADMLPNKYVLN